MLEFENMEKVRQFFENEEQKNKQTKETSIKQQLAERKQQLAERKQDLAERKQKQKEQEAEQRQHQTEKKQNGSGALLFCILGFLAIIIEVIFCLCILCKY